MTKIILLGDAWGSEEALQRRPFIGPAGYCLNSMLSMAGITRSDCYATNVFNLRPDGNEIKSLCGPYEDRVPGYPSLVQGRYVRREYQPELSRLAEELTQDHNLIVALGNTATWFLLKATAISKIRGTVTESFYGKVLPTYHPAAVLRDWSLRPITVMDLKKARRESETAAFRRPQRFVWINPDLDDIALFYEQHLRHARRLAWDIETRDDQITCIGFAPDTEHALVIPFVDYRKENNSYWLTAGEERAAWEWVRRILNLPALKITQNGVYDMHFIFRRYGIRVRNPEHDTMLMHHAIQPESPKGLGFLGSIYTNEASWKLMRNKKTIKRDD